MKRLSLMALTLLAGCTIGVEPRLDEEFVLRPGESARIVDTPVTVRFWEVTQDSRCATRAQCVWAGDGVIELHVTTRGVEGVVTVELHTNQEFDQTFQVMEGVELELTALNPYPETPGGIDAGSYEVTLIARTRQ